MPKYQHYEDAPAWQEAPRFYHLVLALLETHGSRFSSGFRNQLDRAATGHDRQCRIRRAAVDGLDGLGGCQPGAGSARSARRKRGNR